MQLAPMRRRVDLQRDRHTADGADTNRPTSKPVANNYLWQYQLLPDDVMNTTEPRPDFEIRFDDLFHGGRWLSFPCDERGRVDIDALSQRARTNYLFARAMVGREYAAPSVRELALGV